MMMHENPQPMPGLARQLIMAVFTSLACCLLLFLFSWHRQLPSMTIADFSLNTPLSLSVLVIISLLFSVLLYLLITTLPPCNVAVPMDQARRDRILRLLRADAYSYLPLPLLVLLTLVWEQIGNNLLLVFIFLIVIIAVKIFFLLEYRSLRK